LAREVSMLAVLVITALGLHLALDDWYRHTVHHDSLPERRSREYAELGRDVDTFVFGDSHALWGVDPPVLGAAYDIALPGQFPAKVHGLLNHLLSEEGSTVRRIVLQADPHTLWPHPEHWFLMRYYAPRMDFVALGRMRGEPLAYGVRGWLGRFAPYVGQRAMMLGYLGDGQPPELAWVRSRPLTRGAILTDGRWLDLPMGERARVARERAGIHFFYGDAIDEVAVAYFRRVLELARDRGIGVVVVEYPVSPAYLAAASKRVDLAEIDRRLDGLLADHPEVRRLDARGLFSGRVELFADPDHINRRGARELSLRIRAELDALGSDGA